MKPTIFSSLPRPLWVYALLLLLGVPLFFFQIFEKHSGGGDDYALYLTEARNIAQGIPFYKTHYIFNESNISYSPPQYPPGYPLLIAPIIGKLGLNIQAICYFNSALCLLLLLCFYTYFRRFTGTIYAVFLSLLITYGGEMIYMKQFALADLPALLCCMGYILVRRNDIFSIPHILLAAFLAGYAILIRTQSVLIVGAEIVYWVGQVIYALIQRLNIVNKVLHVPVIISVGAFTVYLFFSKLIFPVPHTADGFYI
ncbi:MAG: hypothetical protein EBX41_10550, partial [Chitinophagia bacterium]|nr:hypothetical protein [Chitinophagia bacterium]